MEFLDMMNEEEILLTPAKSHEIIDALNGASLITLMSVAATIFDIVEVAGIKPEELFKTIQETRETVKEQLRDIT